MNYEEELVTLIRNIKHEGILEYLYTFVKLFLEKWG